MKGVVRSPRWRLGGALAVLAGAVAHLLLHNIWVSLFLTVAVWGLVTFAAIGRGGDADEMWTEEAD